ncbi:zinc-binding dehydrogenase [Streptomyces sp. NPDC001714]|uniref:zinc-binding dehydrogenase n=1 Tax=Streptomyces sp. NPDC001714 TaxID=3364603 RepID=UPI0036CED91A
MAVQAAKVLGAGRVVAAGRNAAALDALKDRGADEVVRLDGDYQAALREASQGGFDLVVDMLYGAPMVATLPTIRPGGRLVNVGMRAGRNVEVPGKVLKGRDLLTYAADLPSAELRQEAHARLAEHVVAGDITPEFEQLPLEQVAEAWKRQGTSPNTKLVLVP